MYPGITRALSIFKTKRYQFAYPSRANDLIGYTYGSRLNGCNFVRVHRSLGCKSYYFLADLKGQTLCFENVMSIVSHSTGIPHKNEGIRIRTVSRLRVLKCEIRFLKRFYFKNTGIDCFSCSSEASLKVNQFDRLNCKEVNPSTSQLVNLYYQSSIDQSV